MFERYSFKRKSCVDCPSAPSKVTEAASPVDPAAAKTEEAKRARPVVMVNVLISVLLLKYA